MTRTKSRRLLFYWQILTKVQLKFPTMKNDNSRRRLSNGKLWLAIGVAVLVILLLLWLTFADLLGDTDVAAFIPPVL